MEAQTVSSGKAGWSQWSTAPRIVAISIIVLAAVVRIWGLGSQSVWQDEAYSIVLARESLPETIEAQVEDSSPPLYYILLHFWIEVLGDSEFGARLLSAVFGVGLVIAALLITTRLFSLEAGLWAGGLLAIAPQAVYYSQEARMYALTPLLALLSVYACHLLCEEPSSKRMGVFIAITGAMLYTQNYGVFVLAAEVLYILSRRKHNPDPRPMLSLMGVVGVYLPWLLVLSRQVAENTTPWIAAPYPRMLFETALHLSFKSWRLPVTGFLKVIWAVGLIAVGVLCLLVVRFVIRARRSEDALMQDRRRAGLLILSYTIVPVMCAFIVSQTKPIYVPGRYDTIVQPGLWILCAVGLTSLPRKWLKGAAAAVLLFALVVSLHSYLATYRKSSDREIANYIAANAGDADLLLFTDLTITPFNYYYPESRLSTLRFPRSRMGWTPRLAFTNDLVYFQEEYDRVIERIKSSMPHKKRLWLVFKPTPAIYPRFLRQLAQEKWLRFEKSVEFEMGHNAENQVEAILIFRLLGDGS